ncbi:hypothetical protein ACLMJK_005615 [Lecanora helva]
MAELAGVVASGISIAAAARQIINITVKLKSYWDQIKDAPEELRDLLEEIKVLGQVLIDIESNQHLRLAPNSTLHPVSSSRCLDYCKKAASRLEELVQSLEVDIGATSRIKRKRASIHVVFKRDKVKRYKGKLTSAVRLLSLSQQIYMASLIHLQPALIIAQLSQAVRHPTTVSADVPVKASSNDTRTYTSYAYVGLLSYIFGKPSVKRTSGGHIEGVEIIARYQAPAWLTNRIWVIGATYARSGWTFKPRCYNVISPNAEIFHLIKAGDITGLQGLLARREASPFDHNEFGWTPLHTALGADVDLAQTNSMVDDRGKTLLHVYATQIRELPDWFMQESAANKHGWRQGIGANLAGKHELVVLNPANDLATDWRASFKALLNLIFDLHVQSHDGQTPFMSLLNEFSPSPGESGYSVSLFRSMAPWLQALHDHGVDLQEYGRREFEIYEAYPDCFDKTRYTYYEIENNLRKGVWHIVDFKYGPLPSDWDIIVEEKRDEDTPSGEMPGGWIDEEYEEKGEEEAEEKNEVEDEIEEARRS